MPVIGCMAMSVRPVQIPFSHIVRILPEKRQVHDNVTWSPVRDSSDVPVVTAAACRSIRNLASRGNGARVRSGHLIENGKLTAPIKDINIIGNGPKALGQISMVGNDLKIDNGTWTCGKDQSVPVSIGIPTVRIDSLSVGGE